MARWKDPKRKAVGNFGDKSSRYYLSKKDKDPGVTVAQVFRLIVLQRFVQRTLHFDSSATSSHEPRCVSTGSGRGQICVRLHPELIFKFCPSTQALELDQVNRT